MGLRRGSDEKPFMCKRRKVTRADWARESSAANYCFIQRRNMTVNDDLLKTVSIDVLRTSQFIAFQPFLAFSECSMGTRSFAFCGSHLFLLHKWLRCWYPSRIVALVQTVALIDLDGS